MAAAKIGMYGRLTRSVVDFYPTRLLCKRFNIRPPPTNDLSNPPDDSAATTGQDETPDIHGVVAVHKTAETTNQPVSSADRHVQPPMSTLKASIKMEDQTPQTAPQRPADDVFRAVFGDSSDDES